MKKWIFIGLAAFCVMAVGAYFLGKQIAKRPKPTVTVESEEERRASISAAFAPTVGVKDPSDVTGNRELMAEVELLFARLGNAYRDEDGKVVKEIINAELMFSFAERSGSLDMGELRPTEKRKLKRAYVDSLEQGMVNAAELNAFRDPKILRLEEIREGELVAYVRAHSVAFDVGTKIRYWLLKNSDGDWQVYDWEDLDEALRVSLLMGVMIPSGKPAPWLDDMVTMVRVVRRLAEDPVGGMQEIGGKAELLLGNSNLPPMIESYGLGMKASSLIANADEESAAEALEILEQKKNLTGDGGLFHYQRGQCFKLLDDYEEAIVCFKQYTAILGWDADTHEEVADSYYWLDDMAKCREHAELGLADYDRSLGCLASLAVCIPADQRDDLAGHIRKFGDDEGREIAYDAILDYAFDVDEMEAFVHVLAMFKADLPDSDLVDVYLELQLEDAKAAEEEGNELPQPDGNDTPQPEGAEE